MSDEKAPTAATNKKIVFICTGNIFRSMTAEYCLRAALPPHSTIQVMSVGLVDAPHDIVPFVRAYLQDRHIDISAHRPTRLNRQHLQHSDLCVAMDFSHQRAISARYQLTVPVFNEVAYGERRAMPDVDEVLPNWMEQQDEAKAYCHGVMDTINLGMPGFISRMEDFFR